jgi:hypothetical protein
VTILPVEKGDEGEKKEKPNDIGLNITGNELVIDGDIEKVLPEITQETKSYVEIVEGDSAELVPAKKLESASQRNILLDIFQYDWRVAVPTSRQSQDGRYFYCKKIHNDIKNNAFEVVSPFYVEADDYNRWRQSLGDIRLVQVENKPLNFFLLENNNGSIHAISTVLKVDKELSGIIPGIKASYNYFYGVVVFGENNKKGLGGAGRFYENASLNNIKFYIVEWNEDYYKIKVVNGIDRPEKLEVVPLLISVQKERRGCRWVLPIE